MNDLEIVRVSECRSSEDVWVFIYIEYLYDIVLRGPFCGQGHISRVLVGFYDLFTFAWNRLCRNLTCDGYTRVDVD